MWRKFKKGNYSRFENGIDLSSRGIISTLGCYAGGGQLLWELQAKGDKGDPWIGVCVEGVGGRRGSKPSQTVFSRANLQSNPFGVEPRIGGENLLKKKKNQEHLSEKPFSTKSRTREPQTDPHVPAVRPAGCGITHVTWPQQRGQLREFFLFYFPLFSEVQAESRLQCFCQRLSTDKNQQTSGLKWAS